MRCTSGMARGVRTCAAVIVAAAAAGLGGCLERAIVVTSDPPGAVVWLNDHEVGRTPVETAFVFYGHYDLRAQLEGYEPVHEKRHAKAPFWEWPGIDLIAGAMPFPIRNRIEWHVELERSPERALGVDATSAALLDRAAELRERTEAESLPDPDA